MNQVRLNCNKCTHEWTPKNQETKPKMCPKCKTEKWENVGFNVPPEGRGEKLKTELLKEQEYIEAKKIVDEWEEAHGGKGSLKRAIDNICKILNMPYKDYMDKRMWENYTNEQLDSMAEQGAP